MSQAHSTRAVAGLAGGDGPPARINPWEDAMARKNPAAYAADPAEGPAAAVPAPAATGAP